MFAFGTIHVGEKWIQVNDDIAGEILEIDISHIVALPLREPVRSFKFVVADGQSTEDSYVIAVFRPKLVIV